MAKTKMHAVDGGHGELLSTQDVIIRSAVACFSAKGFSATSIRDIATQAGVAKGNVYHYFSGKDEVLRLILHRVLDELLGAVDGIPYADMEFADQLYAFMGVMVDFVGRNREGNAIIVQERRRLSEPSFADVLARADEMVGKLTGLLERGIAQGEIRPLLSAKFMALGLIGMATWVYQWYQPCLLSLAEIARIYADVVFEGIGVGPGNRAVPALGVAPLASPEPNAGPTTREALLRAALDLFVMKEYSNTSIKDLAEHANVTTGAFYSQFASKDEILRHIDNRFLDRLLASIDRVLEQDRPASELLAGLMAKMMGEVGDHQTELAIYLHEWRFVGTDAFADVRAKSARFVDKFVTVLDIGKDQGALQALSSPRVIAMGLIGMCSFAFQWSEPSDVVPPGTARMYAEVVLGGLRNREQ